MSSPLEHPTSMPPAADANALETLKSRLHEFAAGECTVDDVRDALLQMCEGSKDAPWEGLALLDQYQRRGLLEPEVSKSLQEQVQRLVFSKQSGAQNIGRSADSPGPSDGTNRDASPGTVKEADREFPRRAVREIPRREVSRTEPADEERVSSQDKFREAFVRRSAQLAAASKRPAAESPAPRAASRPPALEPEPAAASSAQAPALAAPTPAMRRPTAIRPAAADPPGKISANDVQVVETFVERSGSYADGTSLADLLLPLGSAVPLKKHSLTIIRGIGEALTHAHAEDQLHTDLRPENVLISVTGKVRVLNFRSSTGPAIGESARVFLSEPPLHASPVPVTNPAYASWERLQGAHPDERNDIYALACISYQLLAGHHPYNGLTAVQARERNMQPTRPALGATGWRALRRALHLGGKKTQSPTARELLMALGCFSAPETLPSVDEIRAQARPPRRPRLLAWSVAAALVAAAAVALAWQGWIYPNTTDYPHLKQRSETTPTSDQTVSGGAAVSTPARLPSSPAVSRRSASPDSATAVAESTQSISGTGSDGLAEAVPVPPIAAPVPVPSPAHSTSALASSTGAGFTGSRSQASGAVGSAPTIAAGSGSTTPAGIAGQPADTRPTGLIADAPPTGARGILTLAEDSYSVDAADGVARIEVRRHKSQHGTVTFKWWTEPGSAKASADYVPVSPVTVTLAPGQSRAQLLVPLVIDPTRKHTEYFDVVIDQPLGGAALGDITRATVILVANNADNSPQ